MSKFNKEQNAVDEQIKLFISNFNEIKEQVGKVFIGQDKLLDDLLSTFFAGGHILIEGVPGLGKTVLAKGFAQAMNLTFERIQCTPDLMPSDVLGHKTLIESGNGDHKLIFQQGPIMAHYILVDEINRATPKTQSALLQAMQECRITIGRDNYDLPQPNIIIATQNPVEHSGTYPLPESQLDRFMVKLKADYPNATEYRSIIKRTTSARSSEPFVVTDVDVLMEMKSLVRNVLIVDDIIDYAVRLVTNTQPENTSLPAVKENIVLGAGPRAVQAMVLIGKVKALLDDRMAVSKLDIKHCAHAVLRHRLLPHFSARFSGNDIDGLISDIIDYVESS